MLSDTVLKCKCRVSFMDNLFVPNCNYDYRIETNVKTNQCLYRVYYLPNKFVRLEGKKFLLYFQNVN